MKRFITFIAVEYNYEGGWNDYSGHFDSLEEALEELQSNFEPEKSDDEIHIVDTAGPEPVVYHYRFNGKKFVRKRKEKQKPMATMKEMTGGL